ncbi:MULTISPECIES: Mrp/NBP35 family ATP-binding protein [Asaia]|uniref:Iron-sulfur cluster carrier protein n=1 Tax=Asaia bogorensis NBRC 16594 TaxID=1231624 RepID=A0AAN4R529_9PROT|nr:MULTISPECIES: Mrp/NBP35 family ATP-binding protein [Asaia]MDL2170981.1 Mrp/NBP35 family ATP-binding protein [Asaia sp. HumB]MDR6183401.1 ATP-binding protein involved in chromosome partitioning [Asaia bogorensis NBRC 16594]BAT20996.1 iron-sulfur cluster assembly/repair protein [Asaia bogorensis NBRC 16594]GBQ74204.1 iron-sulfur cluster assembly/repair protein ApbC [Asaia bogorensis NBRC 16594]GEL54533.1 iron-sulfur cluster carrier protein [Asaia bogorensis NBRC 16594]
MTDFEKPANEEDQRRILETLRLVQDEAGTSNVLSFASLEGVAVRDGHAHVSLATSREDAARIEPLRPRAEAALARLPGISRATIILTAHRAPGKAAPQPQGHRPFQLEQPANSPGHPQPMRPDGKALPQVRAIIAVASGKGGVGKSTTAVNLAAGLAKLGLRTGMLDADIYGPSLPRMLGHSAKPALENGKIIPVEAWGMHAMSIGFLVDEQQAMIWRGPMVMGAIGQFLGDVAWPALDVLVIDMPPGTGDAQLTIAQKLSLRGAVIVSTPQDIALLDARRGLTMFERMNVPLLGVVENMSYFCCPNCNHRTELFGHGGARAEAEKANVPFLGEIPLLADIRMSADAGTPIILSSPDSEAAQAYTRLARAVADSLRLEPGA